MSVVTKATLHTYFDCFELLSSNQQSVSWLRTPCYSKQLYISKSYEDLWDHTCGDLIKNPDSWFRHLVLAESIKNHDTENNKEILAPVINRYKIKGRHKSMIDIIDFTFPIFDDSHKKLAVGGFATVAKLEVSKTIAANRRLMISRQELVCLRYTLEGLTAQDIAIKLGLSKRTIETYLENLKDKTGCKNKLQLIAFACTNPEIQQSLNTL